MAWYHFQLQEIKERDIQGHEYEYEYMNMLVCCVCMHTHAHTCVLRVKERNQQFT